MKKATNGKSFVYHALIDGDAVWPDDFYLVATVSSMDLSQVWRLTNDGDLTDEELSLLRWSYPARSLMVGDVVSNIQGTFLCSPSGWQKL